MFRRHSPSSRGFTLLEVLVAITILAFGVVTLLQVFSLGLRLGARSTASTLSAADGARIMDEWVARKKWTEGAESGGLGANGKWRSQIQTVRDSPSSLGLTNNWELKELAVELSEPDGGRDRLLELKTYRLARKANR